MIGADDYISNSVPWQWLDLADTSKKFNKIWGNDFLIMDENSYAGGIGESDYEYVIDSLMTVWEAKSYLGSFF